MVEILDNKRREEVRKGWYKKAKKKFIRKKIYSWKLCEPFGSIGKYEIEFIHNEGTRITFQSKSHKYQALKKAQILGFVKGFFYARKLHQEAPDFWWFFYEKRIE